MALQAVCGTRQNYMKKFSQAKYTKNS